MTNFPRVRRSVDHASDRDKICGMDTVQLLPLREGTRRLTRRGIDARHKIVTGMVACIGRLGFAATTVEHVMAETGLSRGSILHQFRNRMELAVATAEYTMEFAIAETRKRATAIADPLERIADYPRIMWETQSQIEGVALTDILLATRWDKELATAIQPITQRIESEVDSELTRLASQAGFSDPAGFVPHGWLLLASIRGLVVEMSFSRSRPLILAAAETLQREHRALCARLAG